MPAYLSRTSIDGKSHFPNRAQDTANKEVVVLRCVGFVMYSFVYLVAVIIPKWLVNELEHIAIRFGTSKNVAKHEPHDPLFITKLIQIIFQNIETRYTNIMFVNLGI